jgi:hypothetical protein
MTDRQLRNANIAMAIVWIAAVIVIALQAAARENNVFLTFRASWFNLAEGRDLYQLNPSHYDYYKYSPTFALLFAPFALLPLAGGLLLWTAVNAGALYYALGRLFTGEILLAARGIVFIDAVGSMQNAQSNVLSAALMILAFVELERRRELTAAIAVTLGTLIKIFPIMAAAFAIFRPYRVPRFALWGILCGVVGILAPLVVVSPDQLKELYRSWGALSQADTMTRGIGYSVMEHIEMLFQLQLPHAPIQLVGAAVLLAPLRRYWMWGNERFRLFFLASVLMYAVIFNHKAESPTFIIATAGVTIWFLTVERTRLAWAAFALFVVGTTLSSSDVMPEVLQEGLFKPYKLKTVPVLFVWVLTQISLWRTGSRRSSGAFGVPAPQSH